MSRRILRGVLYVNLGLSALFAVVATQGHQPGLYVVMCVAGLFCSAVAAVELRWGDDG